MRSGLRLLVGYLCQVGGNSYLRCWPRNAVLSRATRAFSILLPPPFPSLFFFFPPPNVCLLCVVSRANGDHVFTTRSMIVATFGNYSVQCRRIRISCEGGYERDRSVFVLDTSYRRESGLSLFYVTCAVRLYREIE